MTAPSADNAAWGGEQHLEFCRWLLESVNDTAYFFKHMLRNNKVCVCVCVSLIREQSICTTCTNGYV